MFSFHNAEGLFTRWLLVTVCASLEHVYACMYACVAACKHACKACACNCGVGTAIKVLCGGNFLHEHPSTAASWDDKQMDDLLQHPDVETVTCDQCEYGLLTPDKDCKPTPARKPTLWASNSWHMLRRLNKRCGGKHKHQAREGYAQRMQKYIR